MAEIKLFRINSETVEELRAESVAIERTLQNLIEKNLESLLGIQFLASEYSTGKTHGGRIDTLGLDGTNRPVIIEYKRALNDSVISQGLFYLTWLMDHRAEFTLLVMRKFGIEASDQIEWTSPRVLCIAGEFAKYDQHAVQQMHHSIELVKYRRFGSELLLLEAITAAKSSGTKTTSTKFAPSPESVIGDKLFRVTCEGMHESSRRMETYKSITDGMLLADFEGDQGDLYKLLKNGQVRRGSA